MTEPQTLIHYLIHWAKTAPDRPALRFKEGGSLKSITWSEYWRSAREVGKALIALGHQPGDCVAIVGANRPEWVQYQLGIQAARGIPAPIYTTNTAEQAGYIVKNSRATLAVCDDKTQLEKYLSAEATGQFPQRLSKILTFDEIEHADDRVMSIAKLRELGRAQPDSELDARIAALGTDETCMLIYTSGTTGVPKGVELDHGGLLCMIGAFRQLFPDMMTPDAYEVVSYLPLCHQAEQLFTNIGALASGGQVTFCPDMAQLKDYLAEARPTIFLGVPRVWEKFEAALRARLAEATGVKAWLAGWATRTELAAFRQQVELGDPEHSTFGRRIARKLVIDKIKAKLGLDRLKIAVTGAAPIAVSTQEFFASLGICIYEGYGMSETSGVATVTDRMKPRFGTVGRALKGVEIRIADDGEVQLKGRNMTKGYLHMPEETKELYTADGWLCTGDLGSMDDEGNLRITGRKKELIITAGGKNVGPVEMENYIKAIPGIGQVMAVGDRKPYLVALITLDPEGLGAFCERVGIPKSSMDEVARHPKVQQYLAERIESECNTKVAKYQTIKKFEVLPVEMTVDGGELTPTMKLRRSFIAEKHAAVIARLYAEEEARAGSSATA